MKNRTLAIFGIITYILGVLSSAEDLQGNFTAPIVLIVISGIASFVFIIWAIIRLWKEYRIISITLLFSVILFSILTITQEFFPSPNGSLIIILLNISKVAEFVATFWAIVTLYQKKNI